MSGYAVLEEHSRGDKLWVPTGPRATEDYVSAYVEFLGIRCVCRAVQCCDVVLDAAPRVSDVRTESHPGIIIMCTRRCKQR